MAKTDLGARNRETVLILGVPVDRVSMAQSLDLIENFVASGQPHLIVTADATGLVLAKSDPTFLELIKGADLVTPDGSGVVWAAKRQGVQNLDRVSGVDILEQTCVLSADKGYRLYFLGAAPGIAELAAERLRLKYPGCNIVGTRHGYFPADSDELVGKEIAESKPDILFVGLGMPRQEKFIKATQSIVGAKVAVGIGGSFDVFSGKTKRAPQWIQRLRFEWLWRLMLNPSKISKVMHLPRFVKLVLTEKP